MKYFLILIRSNQRQGPDTGQHLLLLLLLLGFCSGTSDLVVLNVLSSEQSATNIR